MLWARTRYRSVMSWLGHPGPDHDLYSHVTGITMIRVVSERGC